MAELIRIAEVAFDARSAGSQALYTYAWIEEAAPGSLVLAPLGARVVLGLVASVRDVRERELGFPKARLRPIQSVVRDFDLPGITLDAIEAVAHRTMCSLPVAVSAALPPGIKDRLVTEWRVADKDAPGLNTFQREALAAIVDSGGVAEESKLKSMAAARRKLLRSLAAAGALEQVVTVRPNPEKSRLTGKLRLTPNMEAIEKFLRGPGKRRAAQSMVLIQLQGSADSSFSPQEIKALTSATDVQIRALIEAGLLEKAEDFDARPQKPIVPNSEQQLAIDAICEAIDTRSYKRFLLFGVTGSGKTEVYLRCAEAALRQGRQVLYLVPEIALTAQVVAQLRGRFGQAVAVLHSNIGRQERLETWARVRRGDCPLVLGARSAVFAPLSNLGLIIMDEEHEGSYKQESAPRYHTKFAASQIAKASRCPLVLGSATPSIESFHEAEHGEITMVRLPKRAGAAQLPSVQVVDLTQIYAERRKTIFTSELEDALEATLARGEQAILFLNRRAFAAFLACRDCGHTFVCPNCAVSLSYHKRIAALKCHHCGHQAKAPSECPACGGTSVAPFGVGVEKVEAMVSERFLGAKVARLDRDVVQRKGALEEVLTAFRSGEVQVLVGTQMVAKGLDFPNVTLVGVVSADISLNLPDFRAQERTFQLLSQVAGRSGRGQTPGRVIIQTLNVDNVAVACAQRHDYEAFYRHAISERNQAHYPPFCDLINVVVSGRIRPKVESAAKALALQLDRALPALTVLGPVDCPLERLHEQWRMHLLIKAKKADDLSSLRAELAGFSSDGAMVTIDVDSYSMM